MDSCKNCLWFDKCNCAEPCEDFTPFSGEDATAMREYEQDLEERAQIYQEIIDEQNS